MDEKRKKTIAIVVCVLLVVAVFSFGWVLSRHYSGLESSNGNNVRTTVRNAQELNRDAQEELDRARTANQDAADANQNAQRAADDLADSTTKLSDLNQSDTDAIDAAERIFRDIDSAN